MSNQEAESFIKTLDEGLAEAEQQMLRDKASRNEPLIYADNDGNIKRVSAKEILLLLLHFLCRNVKSIILW